MSRHITPDEAMHFDGKSQTSIAILEKATAERGCSCRPYEDWFTFNRWMAFGKVVLKGQHGTKVPIVRATVKKDSSGEDKIVKFPSTTTVFCRCQVHDLNNRNPELITAGYPFVHEAESFVVKPFVMEV